MIQFGIDAKNKLTCLKAHNQLVLKSYEPIGLGKSLIFLVQNYNSKKGVDNKTDSVLNNRTRSTRDAEYDSHHCTVEQIKVIQKPRFNKSITLTISQTKPV